MVPESEVNELDGGVNAPNVELHVQEERSIACIFLCRGRGRRLGDLAGTDNAPSFAAACPVDGLGIDNGHWCGPGSLLFLTRRLLSPW